ncbi:hypothetical protein CHS0354_017930 [Potamilus streckersoni]|uniref:Uncharacterized protein n=1 Tax=Potamilus streckersoni TaxID=2493646 RepID=A0AAE0RVY6_9BIVA|nr:hypothetical protein CHS0354_017930 [Potamilus streckersoni]
MKTYTPERRKKKTSNSNDKSTQKHSANLYVMDYRKEKRAKKIDEESKKEIKSETPHRRKANRNMNLTVPLKRNGKKLGNIKAYSTVPDCLRIVTVIRTIRPLPYTHLLSLILPTPEQSTQKALSKSILQVCAPPCLIRISLAMYMWGEGMPNVVKECSRPFLYNSANNLFPPRMSVG